MRNYLVVILRQRSIKNYGYKVEFYYVFNDWFKQSGYKDTLEYIEEMGCKYFWGEIPFKYLGLEFNKSSEEIIRVTYKP